MLKVTLFSPENPPSHLHRIFNDRYGHAEITKDLDVYYITIGQHLKASERRMLDCKTCPLSFCFPSYERVLHLSSPVNPQSSIGAGESSRDYNQSWSSSHP